jgi:hypothetical protein
MDKIPFKWKKIEEDTYRAKVFGGWLVKSEQAYGLVFVKDERFDWEIKHEPAEVQ